MFDRLWDFELGGELLSEDRLLDFVDLIGNKLVNVDQVVPSLKPITTNSLLHNSLFALNGRLLVVELPPLFENPIVNERIVVAAVSQSVMDHNSVKLVGSLLLVGIGFFQDGLHLVDFLLQDLLLRLCRLAVLRQNSKSGLQLVFIHPELALA